MSIRFSIQELGGDEMVKEWGKFHSKVIQGWRNLSLSEKLFYIKRLYIPQMFTEIGPDTFEATRKIFFVSGIIHSIICFLNYIGLNDLTYDADHRHKKLYDNLFTELNIPSDLTIGSFRLIHDQSDSIEIFVPLTVVEFKKGRSRLIIQAVENNGSSGVPNSVLCQLVKNSLISNLFRGLFSDTSGAEYLELDPESIVITKSLIDEETVHATLKHRSFAVNNDKLPFGYMLVMILLKSS
ncbi:unnamed protein product [Ambrosiozyma monospora]|uniref:Unnamed protein product n=1 Tax=Ambrosiozyma monospora TaxID=43982 RepID=A0ACB5SYM7_AMBMO|nr:unnamed protein product [Ambrosiozyma monospora]